MLASQQAEKKKKFLGRERQVKSERGRSGGALLEDLRVTVDVGPDDVDGATAEEDGDEAGKRKIPDTEDELDGDETVSRQGGATALKHRLSEFLHLLVAKTQLNSINSNEASEDRWCTAKCCNQKEPFQISIFL